MLSWTASMLHEPSLPFYRGVQLALAIYVQKKSGFRFGIDAVMLAGFVRFQKDARCADLGTGSLIIPLLLYGSGKASTISAVEVQQSYADMASRTASMNRIDDKIKVINCNVKEISSHLPTHFFDIVTANPPYKEMNGGILSPKEDKLIARFEKEGTLRDFIRCAYYLLRVRGSFYMVHRPERLCDILTFMRDEKLEPKRIQFIHSYASKPPTLVLIEGQKCANPKLSVLPPLIVYQETGGYTDEIAALYKEFHYEI